MSTANSVQPLPAMRAARQAVLFHMAMSSGTPIDGANIRATTPPERVGAEKT